MPSRNYKNFVYNKTNKRKREKDRHIMSGVWKEWDMANKTKKKHNIKRRKHPIMGYLPKLREHKPN